MVKVDIFHQARKHNVDQARKAVHVLFKRIRNLNIPIDLQLHLFDHVILPFALYGCEIWGFENVYNDYKDAFRTGYHSSFQITKFYSH